MSKLFDDLYRQAMQREHVLAGYAGRLMNALQCSPLDAKRHAANLDELYDEFHSRLMLTARRNRMRVRASHGHIPHGTLLMVAIGGELPHLSDLPEEET